MCGDFNAPVVKIGVLCVDLLGAFLAEVHSQRRQVAHADDPVLVVVA
jgi:hypothetical protein